jgi:tetratricopeptide (TPR) repeat protein
LDPLDVGARLALARAEAEKGRYRQSLEFATPVLPALKQSPDGLLVLAADLAKLGKHAALADLATDWMHLNGVPADWSIKFALLLANNGAVPQAIEVLERTKQTSTPSYQLAFNLGGAYSMKHEFLRALDSYDEALTFDPRSMPALRQAAFIAEQQGELERSLSYWIRAKKIEPENPEILLGFGRICLKLDLLEDADPALTRAANLRPQDPLYKYTLAAAKTGKKEFEVAQSLLQELVTTRTNDPQLQYALGAVLYLEGHLADAAAHLRESLRLQPDQLGSNYYLALVARDQQNDAEAIRILEQVLQRHPDHASSHEVLGTLLMVANRYADAKRNLEQAIRLNPKSVKANYQLGLLLARMGRKEEADKQLEMARSLRKEDEETSRLQLRLLDPDQ